MANVSDRLREALERLDQAIDRLDATATAEHGGGNGAAAGHDSADTAALAARLDKMIQRIEAALAG
ncbi:MAG TPA: hypothetical protein VH722_17315 [Alphaproteobacteria bacterium]|nr:hypothetical protein [Alphaproteobacteria bacterium]